MSTAPSDDDDRTRIADQSKDDGRTRIAPGGAATVIIAQTPKPPGGAPSLGHNAFEVGQKIGEFEILGLVGEGGFGIVYLAYDHSLDRKVARK